MVPALLCLRGRPRRRQAPLATAFLPRPALARQPPPPAPPVAVAPTQPRPPPHRACPEAASAGRGRSLAVAAREQPELRLIAPEQHDHEERVRQNEQPALRAHGHDELPEGVLMHAAARP